MAARKEIEKKVKLREFQRSVNQLLSTEDRDYLFYALREYNTYKSVAKLMLALNSCLDTPEKLDLLPYVRDLIPKHDKKKFDSLAPYNQMAHPLALQLEQESHTPKHGETVKSFARASTRVINLQRPPGTPLGFSIRGGVEHNLGIYLSHVDSLSLAERSGMKVGDQIVNVNGIDFNRVSHSSAVLVLKSHDNLRIEVKNTGIMPGQKMDRNSILWVDPSGKPIKDTDSMPESPLLEKREEVSGGRLLTSNQRHKVVLHAQKKKDLGFSVRGGQEYGLGIYISAVDSGSPAEEAGLQVGDQVMDVNGHSFVSIQHQEAVHILRTYQNLILTIKSLGRIPKLASEATAPKEGTKANPSSPYTRRRASSFLKSLKNKLSTHSEEEEEEEEEEQEEKKQSHVQVKEDKPEKRPRSRSATVQRSQSMKTHKSDTQKRQPASSSGTAGHLDLARSSSVDSAQQKSISAGSSPVLPRTFPRKQMSISPLATHEARAASTLATGGEGRLRVTPKFFEKGVGTQVMLSSTTSSLAKELLFDKARRLLEEDEVDSLRDHAQQYETNGDIEAYAQFLISILDTPEKMNLLTEVRSVLSPSDIVHFDQIVSAQEVQVLQQYHSSDTDEEDNSDGDDAQNYQMVLKAIKNHNGQGLRKTHPEQFIRKSYHPNLGAFGNAKAQSLLSRATDSVSEPDLIALQTKESFLAWYDDEEKERMGASMSALPTTPKIINTNKPSTPPPVASRNPVIIDIVKNAGYLGMSVESRSDQRIRVRHIREGGIIANDGFMKPGFEIVEVDGKRLRGKSQSEATHVLAEAFNNANQIMTFIVIPTN